MEVDLTNEAYSRWLRACRPDLVWFLSQAEDVQEQLAILGDDYVQDVCIGIGYAVSNPAAAEAGTKTSAGSMDAEVDLVQQLAAAAVRKMVGAHPSAPPPPPPPRRRETMAGVFDRKRPVKSREPKQFLGRQEDGAT